MRALRAWSVRHAGTLGGVYAVGERLAVAARPLLSRLPHSVLVRVLRPVERFAKSTLFDCRMCGQCALSRTGMACPMNCPKQLRNGPCGGVRQDGMCEVDESMRCVWMEARRGMAHLPPPTRARLLPVDRGREGQSTWAQVVRDSMPALVDAARAEPRHLTHPTHRFAQALRAGRPVVTVELAPPDAADPTAFLARARRFEGLVDAINVTDGAGGNCHMSSVAAASLLVRHGFHAVAQVTCRDRNRIAIQGDVLGAHALGVQSFLCLTGDDVGAGDQPQAKRVFDLDAVNLVATLARLRDRGEYASGRKLDAPLDILLGATCNPFAPPFTDRLDNLELKIRAGARFIQTQFCFDVERMARFMEGVRARGLHREAAIIVGVGILPSARGLTFMSRHVPGVHVPQRFIDGIAAAADQRAAGVAAVVDLVARLRDIDGIAGFHLMGHRNEQMLVEIIETARLAVTPAARDAGECA